MTYRVAEYFLDGDCLPEGFREHGSYVVRGDLRVLKADAYLVPSDAYGEVEPAWDWLIGDLRNEIVHRQGELASDDFLFFPSCGDQSALLVVNVGGSSAVNDPDDLSTRLRRALQGFQDQLDRDASKVSAHRGDRVLLALPVIGVGRGGLGGHTGDVLRHLDEVLSTRHEWLSGPTGFDAVVVCRSKSDYAALQHVRRRTLRGVPDWVKRLADFARDGRLSIMFGAGASVPLGLPSWAGLLDQVGAELGMEAGERQALVELDPVDAATILADRAGSKEAFHALVAPFVTTDEVSLTHALMASVGTRLAITTNYDHCYETAVLAAGDRQVVVLPWEQIPDYESPAVLKLHGDVSRGQIVLAREDFASMQVRRRPLIGVVQERLLVGHVLTVGSSVSDPTLVQAAEEVGSLLSQVRSTDDQTFGTVVLTQRHLARELLLGRNFDLVLPQAADHSSVEDVARRVDLLLDLIACLSSNSLAFALDANYEGLLDESEAAVAVELRQAAREVRTRLRAGDTNELTARAEEFFASLGAPSPAHRGSAETGAR